MSGLEYNPSENTSTDLKALSQENLDNPHKTLHRHLTSTISPTHLHDIYGGTVSDFPYTSSKHGADFEPGIAVATAAATVARPHGTLENDWTQKHKHLTPLQQHVVYWDPDNDGIIWPQDIFYGCSAWGWNPILSLIVVLVIAPAMSYPTQKSWIPDPFFRIYVSRIHRAKHGSDTGIYDNKGRFRPQNFEEVFANYDRDNKGGLSPVDLMKMWIGQRLLMDFFGWTAFVLEWLATYLLVWPEDRVLRKEDVRKVYDGSIFQEKAKKNTAFARR